MKNNYFPQSMDLDIFLEGNEVEELGQYTIEGELTEHGEPLGKKLIIKHYEFDALGDGIKVKYLKVDPEGGWDQITAIEVLLNNKAYSRLKQMNRTGSRHGLDAKINIYGPGALEF